MTEKLEIKYQHLPDYFTNLLKANMQSQGKAFFNLRKSVWENRSFYGVVCQTFEDIDPKMRLEKIVGGLGWSGFRNRLAASFLYYQCEGHFPQSYRPELVKNLLVFEKRLEPYSIEGYSRGFLLGFFLEMSYQNQEKLRANEDFFHFEILESTLDCLEFSRFKVFTLDWIILLLYHLKIYLGEKKLKTYLKTGSCFDQILASLEDFQRDELFSNFLSYGASIGETDVFCGEIV